MKFLKERLIFQSSTFVFGPRSCELGSEGAGEEAAQVALLELLLSPGGALLAGAVRATWLQNLEGLIN